MRPLILAIDSIVGIKFGLQPLLFPNGPSAAVMDEGKKSISVCVVVFFLFVGVYRAINLIFFSSRKVQRYIIGGKTTNGKDISPDVVLTCRDRYPPF